MGVTFTRSVIFAQVTILHILNLNVLFLYSLFPLLFLFNFFNFNFLINNFVLNF